MNRRPAPYLKMIFKTAGCILIFLVALTVGWVSSARTYQLADHKWPEPSATFHVDIPGADGLWNEAFEGAMHEWSAATVFQFYIVRGIYSDPCDPDDDRNGAGFAVTSCGVPWGSTTLATTTTWHVGSTIVESDIVFNANEDWDVYTGPWQSRVNDFRRVAVHELGHALGLKHEDSGIPTIMKTYVGDATVPQQDDIDGIAALYGGGIPEEISAVLSASSPDLVVMSGTDAWIYGTSGTNRITLESGAQARLINFPGQNFIHIQSDSNQFQVFRSGTVVTFIGADGTVLTMPATASGQTISFRDQDFTLIIGNHQVKLGSQSIGLKSSRITGMP